MGTGRRLRIAMIGQKGVPATYGGIERHVEELGARLAARGHEVTVYCRPSYETERLDTFRGMRLRYLPTAGTKHLDAIVHSGVSAVASMRAGHDVVHFHALGPGLVAPLPRYLSRSNVVLTVHGLDNERAKWGPLARTVLGTAHWMSARVPDATVVVADGLARHYRERFGRATTHIPNGVAEPDPRPAEAIRRRWGLTEGSYVLFVGRLVPEKAPDLLLRAFRDVPGDVRLVIAGDSSFTDEYVAALRRTAGADPRVLLAGYVHGAELSELYTNAAAYVQPSFLEGLPLTLLEAASYDVPVVVSDIDPHLEIVGHDAPGRRTFPVGDGDALAKTLTSVLAEPVAERAGGAALGAQVRERYRWDAVAEATERLYLSLLA